MNLTSSRQLNIRVSPELIHDLDEIAQAEQLDRTMVVRRLLQEAIQNWKLAYALRLCREERITKERAAEIAGVSLYEIIEAARQQRIPPSLTVSEALEEIEQIVARHGLEAGRQAAG